MKKLNVFLVLFFLILTKGYTQENSSKPELRLSYITGVVGPVGRNLEMIKFSADPTSLISGFDLKMIFPTKRENLHWLLGTFFQDGEDNGGYYSSSQSSSNNNTLAGAIYLGPQISTSFKYVNFLAYISGGIFSISDGTTVITQNEILFNSVSHYTAAGTKSGLGLSFRYKSISLTGGYQIFMTSAKNSTLAYQGIEIGIGVKF